MVFSHLLRVEVAIDTYSPTIVTFDPKAESRLRLKIDLMIIPTVALLYLFCFIERSNIGNARLAGLEKDLGLTGNDYNAVLSVFYVSYILFEVRSSPEEPGREVVLTKATRFQRTCAANGSGPVGSYHSCRWAVVSLALPLRS